MVFSVGAASKLYNEDVRQLKYNWGSLWRRQSKMMEKRRRSVSYSAFWSVQ
jgi:hypothetical protein